MADQNDNDQPHSGGNSSTPLLFLLDGVLSQDDDRVNEAVHEIQRLVPSLQPAATVAPSDNTALATTATASASLCTDSVQLCRIVTALLEHCPELASVRSEHDGSLPLHFAASLGNVQVAQTILEKYPAAASSPNDKGKIPLHYAAREGRSLDMVRYFLQAAPETCSMATSKGKLAVHFAAGDGHVAITSALLQQYPHSAALPSSKGKLPLHFCARWGYLDIAYELLSVYPDSVRALDWEGSLPLHDAAREGQYRMSRYLIERFPVALQTANLRGEIPLFPAVRSANVELVLLMIQAWPLGGKHILRHVSADDNVSSWNGDILELLLRGAVNNLYDCALLVGHEPPTVRLTDDLQPEQLTLAATASARVSLKKAKKIKAVSSLSTLPTAVLAAATVPALATTSLSVVPSGAFVPHPYQPRLVQDSAPPLVSSNLAGLDQKRPAIDTTMVSKCFTSSSGASKVSPMVMPLVRSKSPILHENGNESSASGAYHPSPGRKKHSRKRSRHHLSSDGRHVEAQQQQQQRTFIPLHAAFECKAASHVIQHVLKQHADDILKMDERGRLALHWAVTHCHEQDAIVDLILGTNSKDATSTARPLFISPETASTVDNDGKLPLHLAIEARADVRIISALLQANPAAGVEPCRLDGVSPTKLGSLTGSCNIRNSDQMAATTTTVTPVEMATHYGCDLSTVFVLLRVDPSLVSRGATQGACLSQLEQPGSTC